MKESKELVYEVSAGIILFTAAAMLYGFVKKEDPVAIRKRCVWFGGQLCNFFAVVTGLVILSDSSFPRLSSRERRI